MKKLLIFTFILLSNILTAWSQPHLIFKVGVSPGLKSFEQSILLNRSNPHEEIIFNLFQVKPQFYAGIGAHLQLRTPFFLEAGIAYTQKTSLYQINYRMPTELNPAMQYMSESEKSILLPVNIGVSLGPIDVTSGLTAMKAISKAKELTHLNGFHQDENALSIGWQMGVRYAVKRASLGVEYQGTLNRVGHGMSVNKQSLELKNVPGNFVFSFQFGF